MSPEKLEKLALAAMKINIMAIDKGLDIKIPIAYPSIDSDVGYQTAYLALLDTVETLIKERIENLQLQEQLAAEKAKSAIGRWMLDRDRQGGA